LKSSARRGLVLGLSLLAATFAPHTVRAAGPDALSDAEDAQVAGKPQYAEGVRLYSKGRYEEARALFAQANALAPRPAVTVMLGLASVKAGRWVEGLHALDKYLAEVADVPPKQRELVEQARREAKSHVGHLRFDVPNGTSVTVDGQPVTKLHDVFDVVTGQHSVVLKHGDETKTQTVNVTADATVDVKPEFAPKALVPPPDVRMRATPVAPPNANDATGTSILSPPKVIWPVYVLGAVGIGGLATAAIFGGISANADHAVDVATTTLGRNGRSKATCEAHPVEIAYAEICTHLKKNVRTSRQMGSIVLPTAVIGITGMAAAVGWFLFAPKDRSETTRSAYVVPWLSVESGGAAVEGQF
jgi:hypothetical protein